MIREDFPILNSSLYFNTAYVGLMSKSLFNYRNKIELEYLHTGDKFKIDANDKINSIQKSISDYINSDKSNTFFVPNFSIGIRIVLDRIWDGAKVLTIAEDYPSIISAIEERSFTVFKLNFSNEIEELIYDSIKNNKIEVIILSIVQYITGYKINFQFLNQLKNKFPDLIIIGDASQYFGTDFFDFSNSPFDVIISSGYKWILAGFGNGFLAFSKNFLERTNSTKEIIYDKVYVGHFDILSTYSLLFAIRKLKDINFKSLVKENKRLILKLKNELVQMELNPFLNKKGSDSSILSIPYNKKIYDLLIKNKVYFSLRGEFIRFSIHFYNNQSDVENLVTILNQKNN
tara:strand:+ start:2556 stop:3590 length:1035 start_codon:yes stop_codon:yes gene_type:complete